MIGRTGRTLTLLMAGTLALGACTQGAASPAASPGSSPAASTCSAGAAAGTQIPEIEDGKFNVAMVLIGPHDDAGWSQAHYEGLLYVCENVENAHVAYIENVPEGADSEQVFRSLSRKGFNFIIGTSFGYMDPMMKLNPLRARDRKVVSESAPSGTFSMYATWAFSTFSQTYSRPS